MTTKTVIDSLLKWSGTATLLAANGVRALDFSHTADVVLSLMGCILWAIAAQRASERALLTINAVSALMLTYGFLSIFLTH